MQFILTVNQVKALEWGLNAQQALLFSFVYTAPSWANPQIVDGKTFYMLSKMKISEELPLLSDRPDTVYRMLKALELVEIIELDSTPKITLVRLTEKGKTWNTSENYPSKVGKKSEVRSEKNPTNQDTNNQDTNNQQNLMSLAATAGDAQAKKEKIPFSKIMEIYNEILGDVFRRALSLDKARTLNITKCWNRQVEGKFIFRSGDFWRMYFTACRDKAFLQGMNDRGWVAHLEYVTRETVVTGVLEDMANEPA